MRAGLPLLLAAAVVSANAEGTARATSVAAVAAASGPATRVAHVSRAGLLEARRNIDACVKQLDAAVDTSYGRIATRCPKLTAQLTDSAFAPWLPADWNEPDNRLTAVGLGHLNSLIEREQTRVALRPAPRAAAVASALAGIRYTQTPGGWWARCKQWLRDLAAQRTAAEQSSWWQRLLGGASLPQTVLHAVVALVLAALLAVALWVVINELRVAGLLGARRRVRAAAAAHGVASGAPLDTLDLPADPQQQPGLLLERVTRCLTQQDRLPPARALTARQVVRQARLPSGADREHLALLAEVSEQLRYSGHSLAPTRLASAVQQGRALLAALEPPHTPVGT